MKFQLKFFVGTVQFPGVQIALAERRMQAGLFRVSAERLPIFLGGVFPTASLQQEIAEKTMPPGRLAVQARSAKCQTRRQIQILVPEFEPGFGFVRVERRHISELFGRGTEVLLA